MTKRAFRGGPRPLAQTVRKVAAPLLRRQGFAEADIVLRWTEIVGERLAARSSPERMETPRGGASAVLHVRVAPGAGPELQHLAPLVLERINAFFGWRAVERLRLVQAPLPSRRGRKPASDEPLSAEQVAALDSALGAATDDRLKQALKSLGASVARAGRRGGSA
jgi:hypothetical protein